MGPIKAERVRGARLVKIEKVKEYYKEEDKGEKEVEGKKSGEGSVVNRKAAPNPYNEILTYIGDGREEVGDYGGGSVAYLAPGEYIAYKCNHYGEEKHNESGSPYVEK